MLISEKKISFSEVKTFCLENILNIWRRKQSGFIVRMSEILHKIIIIFVTRFMSVSKNNHSPFLKQSDIVATGALFGLESPGIFP